MAAKVRLVANGCASSISTDRWPAPASDVWAVIEPDIHAISEAYWQQWLRCFADDRVWAPHETAKMIDLGVDFLRMRFLKTSERGWVESIARSVAAAYAGKVEPEALLSMINASDRAALDSLMRASTATIRGCRR